MVRVLLFFLLLSLAAVARDEVQILPLAARTATTTSAQFDVRSGMGLVLLVDVTSITASPNVSKIELQARGNEGTWATVYQFATLTAVSATGLYTFAIYPGAASAASWTSAPLQGPIPTRCRLKLTHDDADSITYSVVAQIVP